MSLGSQMLSDLSCVPATTMLFMPIKACPGQGSFCQSLESRAPFDLERPIEQRYCYSDQANIGIFQEMDSCLEMIQ